MPISNRYKEIMDKPMDTLVLKVKQLEAELKKKEEETASKFTIIGQGGKTAILRAIPNICPECLNMCEVTFMPDHLRVRIRHHHNDGCSRSMTDIIRPIAEFTEFI